MDEKIQIEHVRFSTRKAGVLLPERQMSRIFSATLLLPTSLLLPVLVLRRLLAMCTSCAAGNKVSVGKGIKKNKNRGFWQNRGTGASQQGPETAMEELATIKQTISH